MKPSGITGVLRDGNLRINTEMSGTIKDHDKLESFMNSVNNSVKIRLRLNKTDSNRLWNKSI